MSLNRYAKRRDTNEPEIFAYLRANGLSVCPIDVPCDAVVGWGGRSYLVEIKMPKKGLNDKQKAFLSDWKGCHVILRTIDDAEAFVRRVKA